MIGTGSAHRRQLGRRGLPISLPARWQPQLVGPSDGWDERQERVATNGRREKEKIKKSEKKDYHQHNKIPIKRNPVNHDGQEPRDGASGKSNDRRRRLWTQH
jgi:hypothetical protein